MVNQKQKKAKNYRTQTHKRSRVVNRTSRYHRSSGLEEHHLTRPQPSRGVEPSFSSPVTTAATSSVSSTSASVGSDLNWGSMGCRAAPIAAAVGASDPVPTCGRFGGFDYITSPRESPIKDRCTCSPNAAYNTTNPRLPPYPEPCELQPEARLRPRMPSHSTASGYTAAAINAATASSAALAGYQQNASLRHVPGRAPQPCSIPRLLHPPCPVWVVFGFQHCRYHRPTEGTGFPTGTKLLKSTSINYLVF
ncbi:hypothetical protein TcWFU_007584 [Taenia crassiceps]|uniref:Uncharacterized protein n=1 Tax=Taenia crassiceps TaxID=6207 RepID=A0ABR4QSH8_9CEST